MPAVNAGFLVENSGVGNNEMEIPKHGVILDGVRVCSYAYKRSG